MKIKIALIITAIIMFAGGCAALKDISQTLSDIKNLQYKLGNVSGIRLAGVDIDNKERIEDFSISEGLKLGNAFRNKNLPMEFILNVDAKNPNDGTGNTRRTSATIANMDWQLYIDGVKTIAGDLATPVTVPESQSSVNIPLRMRLDLFEFFGDRGYEGILKLALKLADMSEEPAMIKLDAKPTVNTSIGPISSPRVTIVNSEWR